MSVELKRTEPLHPKLLEVITSSGKNFIFAPLGTREFLKRALLEGAHIRKPDGISEKDWIRMRNIIGIYFSTAADTTQIGRIYGVSREAIRQLKQKGIKLLWQNSSSEAQEQFPIDQILLGKKSGDYPDEYKLLVKGGVGNKIVNLLEEDRDIREIAEALNLTRQSTLPRLRLLKRLGTEIPKFKDINTQNKELIAKLNDETLANDEIQALLNQARFGFCERNTLGANPLFSRVFKFLNECGFRHIPLKERRRFIQLLKEVGLPMCSFSERVNSKKQKGVRNSYFMLARHRKWAERILQERPELERFKKSSVQQICGPEIELPSIWQLLSGKEFESPQNAVPEIRLNRRYKRLLTPDCPVTILKRGNDTYFSPKNQRAELRAYILGKLGMRTLA